MGWMIAAIVATTLAKIGGALINYSANKDARELEEDLLNDTENAIDETEVLEDEADEIEKGIIEDKKDILGAEYLYEKGSLEYERSKTLGSIEARTGASGIAGASPMLVLQSMANEYARAELKLDTVYNKQLSIMSSQTELIDIGGEIRDIKVDLDKKKLQYERDINAIEDKWSGLGLGLEIGGAIGEGIFNIASLGVKPKDIDTLTY